MCYSGDYLLTIKKKLTKNPQILNAAHVFVRTCLQFTKGDICTHTFTASVIMVCFSILHNVVLKVYMTVLVSGCFRSHFERCRHRGRSFSSTSVVYIMLETVCVS